MTQGELSDILAKDTFSQAGAFALLEPYSVRQNNNSASRIQGMKHYFITIMKIVYVNYVISLKYVSQKLFQRLSHTAQLSCHLYQHSLTLFDGTSPTSIFHSDSDGKLPAYKHRVKAQPTKHKEKSHRNVVLLHSVISKL